MTRHDPAGNGADTHCYAPDSLRHRYDIYRLVRRILAGVVTTAARVGSVVR